MFNAYFKVAYRNLLKNKVFSLINIIGLAIGLACSILVFLWVMDETSYDKFHDKYNDLYRVVMVVTTQQEEYHVALTPLPLSQKLSDEIPGIEQVSRYWPRKTGKVMFINDEISENRLACVDPGFLKMFAFPLLMGDSSEALNSPNSVIITEQISEKYFENKDPIGETILIDEKEYSITGVLERIPNNTHFRFDYLVPISSPHGFGNNQSNNWGVCDLYTYVRLNKLYDGETVSESIAGLRKKYLPGSDGTLVLEPVSDIHLYHKYDDFSTSRGDIKLVYLFSFLAITILTMAVINFAGLSATQFTYRSREIGVRKIMGATRPHLIIQSVCESTILVFISLIVAVIFLEYTLPWFNRFAVKSLSITYFANVYHLVGLIGFGIVTGIFAGLYPAFYLSSLKPLRTLAQTVGYPSHRRLVQKGLVVFQFTVAIAFMVAVITINRQLSFMKDGDIGFNKDQIIYVPLTGDIRQHQESFKRTVQNHHGIQGVALGFLPVGFMPSTVRWDWEGKNQDDEIRMHAVFADHDYITTLGIDIIEGRDFSPAFPSDEDHAYIINESAKRTMGFADAIDKKLSYMGHGSNRLEGSIIGVVKNFHFSSYHNEIGPAVLMIRPIMNRHLCIKIDTVNIQETIKFIETTWYSYVNDQHFGHYYLSHTIDNLYSKEMRAVELVSYVTILTVIIACLGILGLSSFMINRRQKEIGIRKVLGASVLSISRMLTREYIILVGISNIIAWPVIYIVMIRWLESFAYRVNVELWTFVVTGIAATIIALMTVGFQSIKAAMVNPTDSLRTE
jgi:ABC-type antimicrobial peptide transport system permease subunit